MNMNTPVTMNMDAPMMTKKQTKILLILLILNHRFNRCVCIYKYITIYNHHIIKFNSKDRNTIEIGTGYQNQQQ